MNEPRRCVKGKGLIEKKSLGTQNNTAMEGKNVRKKGPKKPIKKGQPYANERKKLHKWPRKDKGKRRKGGVERILY